jgi:DNA-directed RNA polymerase subunit omega
MLIRPKVDELLENMDSKYSLVIAASKRARQINDYFSSIKKHELPRVRPPQIESISKSAITLALEEIAAGKLEVERNDEELKRIQEADKRQ